MSKNTNTKYEVRSTKYERPIPAKSFGYRKIVLRTSYFVLIILAFFFAGFTNSGCNIYKLNEAVVPDSIKTIKINFIENKAPYVNPTLSPRLTDKLRQKIVSQTRLSQ
ncbi:MAG: hypothetical protein ABIR18_07330, partial [Chitinophagaceae bacterium]